METASWRSMILVDDCLFSVDAYYEFVLTIIYFIATGPLLCFALQRKAKLLLAENSAQTPTRFPYPFWVRNRSLKWMKTNSRSFVAFQNQHQTRHWCFLAQQESGARMPAPMQHRPVTQSLSTTWVEPTSGLLRNEISMQDVPFWIRKYKKLGLLSFLRNIQNPALNVSSRMGIAIFCSFCCHASCWLNHVWV